MPKNSPTLDAKREPVDRDRVAVALVQVAHVDRDSLLGHRSDGRSVLGEHATRRSRGRGRSRSRRSTGIGADAQHPRGRSSVRSTIVEATALGELAAVEIDLDARIRAARSASSQVVAGRLAGAVGAGHGERAVLDQQLEHELVVGHADRDRATGIAEVPPQRGLLRADHRERAWPERLDQALAVTHPGSR